MAHWIAINRFCFLNIWGRIGYMLILFKTSRLSSLHCLDNNMAIKSCHLLFLPLCFRVWEKSCFRYIKDKNKIYFFLRTVKLVTITSKKIDLKFIISLSCRSKFWTTCLLYFHSFAMSSDIVPSHAWLESKCLKKGNKLENKTRFINKRKLNIV